MILALLANVSKANIEFHKPDKYSQLFLKELSEYFDMFIPNSMAIDIYSKIDEFATATTGQFMNEEQRYKIWMMAKKWDSKEWNSKQPYKAFYGWVQR